MTGFAPHPDPPPQGPQGGKGQIRFLRGLTIGSVLALGLLLITACAPTRLPVIATFSILGDIVQNVGGDLIMVQVLVGVGQDTHEFEPTPADAVAVRRASLIFENGLGFEGWLDRLYAASGSQAWRIISTARIKPFVQAANGTREADPHVWGDVQNVISMTNVIAAALSEADPDHANAYAANAAAYVARLNDLDVWVQQQIDTLPSNRRQLFSNHEALGYLARRYGLTISGSVVESFSTEAQPSAQQVARLVQSLRASGARVIFIENVANPALAQQVARAAGATVAPELYTDALGGPDTPAASYIGLMTYNVATIVAAVGS